jgi:hypothetical protein
MSRSAPNVNTTFPVAPGTSVVTPMYTSVGFDAGDYVYQYGANLVGWPKGSTIGMGAEAVAIAGATYTGYKQTSNSRAVSLGPMSDQIVFTGTTSTIGQTIVSPTVLSGASFASGYAKSAALTDGRIAFAYASASGTITSAIYSAAGALQGTTTQLTTTANLNNRQFTMCALSDGGFIVGWYDASASAMKYSRLNSSNAVTVNNVSIVGGAVVELHAAATPDYYAFSWHVTDSVSTAQLKPYFMTSNSTSGTYNASLTSVYASACAGTSQNTFYLAAGDFSAAQIYYAHVNASNAGVLGSLTNTGSYTNGYSFDGCSATASATYPGAYAATFLVNDSSGTAQLARVYATTATTPTVLVTTISITSSLAVSIGSLNAGGCITVVRSTSTGNLQYSVFNGASSIVASGTLVSAASPSGAFSIGVSGIAGGSFVLAYPAPTTGFSTFLTAYSSAYTSGVTVLTSGNTYTPETGYSLRGVALTTAAAGSTGLVATNGLVNLGASYPTATSNIQFDYTGTAFTARSAVTAQSGNVIGTTVTLKGLE